MQMRSGNLTIRTWDRPAIQISSDYPVAARRFGPAAVDRALPGGNIPIFATSVQTPGGPVALPSEEFSATSLTAGSHDGVAIFGGDRGATVTLTVPSSSALVWALVGRGSVQVQGYRGGTFVARVHTGALVLRNVSGDAYVEVARGKIAIDGSAFNRVRARTAIGNIVFHNCNARQIEVSSVTGSIAYDDGTFVPGLARFETQSGNVALGIAGGGAQVGAHSSSGRIYSDFARGAQVRGGGTDAQAIVGGGGPVVTASSQSGGVYLYDGAFASRPALQRRWHPVGKILRSGPRRPRLRRP